MPPRPTPRRRIAPTATGPARLARAMRRARHPADPRLDRLRVRRQQGRALPSRPTRPTRRASMARASWPARRRCWPPARGRRAPHLLGLCRDGQELRAHHAGRGAARPTGCGSSRTSVAARPAPTTSRPRSSTSPPLPRSWRPATPACSTLAGTGCDHLARLRDRHLRERRPLRRRRCPRSRRSRTADWPTPAKRPADSRLDCGLAAQRLRGDDAGLATEPRPGDRHALQRRQPSPSASRMTRAPHACAAGGVAKAETGGVSASVSERASRCSEPSAAAVERVAEDRTAQHLGAVQPDLVRAPGPRPQPQPCHSRRAAKHRPLRHRPLARRVERHAPATRTRAAQDRRVHDTARTVRRRRAPPPSRSSRRARTRTPPAPRSGPRGGARSAGSRRCPRRAGGRATDRWDDG